jgi:hypothetical protein
MHTLTEESILPCGNTAATTLDWAAFDRIIFDDGAGIPAASARIRASGEWQHEAEWLAMQLPAEPSGETLVAAFGAGGLCGMLVATLLVPAVPALAFGGALGAYAGVLAASLWVSRTASGMC